tara:strand:+ start:286 stop:603 length:318 start_codon:yes stop_codon:yes gene_type:complete
MSKEINNNMKQTGIKYLLEKKKNEEVLGENDGYHAWFSPTQKKCTLDIYKLSNNKSPLSSIYLDFDGNEVEVTYVSKNINSINNTSWDDFKYVGKVKKWVRGIFI